MASLRHWLFLFFGVSQYFLGLVCGYCKEICKNVWIWQRSAAEGYLHCDWPAPITWRAARDKKKEKCAYGGVCVSCENWREYKKSIFGKTCSVLRIFGIPRQPFCLGSVVSRISVRYSVLTQPITLRLVHVRFVAHAWTRADYSDNVNWYVADLCFYFFEWFLACRRALVFPSIFTPVRMCIFREEFCLATIRWRPQRRKIHSQLLMRSVE